MWTGIIGNVFARATAVEHVFMAMRVAEQCFVADAAIVAAWCNSNERRRGEGGDGEDKGLSLIHI